MGRKSGSFKVTTEEKSGPPDGGWGWVCVFGRFYCHFCIFGIPSAFGILYVELVDFYDTSREVTAWVGSLSHGLIFLIGPLTSVLNTRFGIQKTAAAGSLLAFSGAFISWFANGVPYLYVSYGVIFGSGLGLFFLPSTVIIVLYFKRRLGLANAIASSGAGLGALVLPPLYTYLVDLYGWRGTLLLLSGIVLNCLACAAVFRPPPYLKYSDKFETSKQSREDCKNFIGLLCNSAISLFGVALATAQLGYSVPFIHLPDMAIQAGIEKYRAAYLISIMGVSNIVGRIILGWISDLACVNIILLHGVTLIVCGIVTAVCPFFSDFYPLAVYCVIQGTGIGVFTAFVPGILMLLAGVNRTGDALGLTSLLSGMTGMVASPIAGALFDRTSSYNASFYLAGSAFLVAGVMDIFVMILHRRQRRKNDQDDPDKEMESRDNRHPQLSASKESEQEISVIMQR